MTLERDFSDSVNISEVRKLRSASDTTELGFSLASKKICCSLSPLSVAIWKSSTASICSLDSGMIPKVAKLTACSSFLGSRTIPASNAITWHTTNPKINPNNAPIATVKTLFGRDGLSGETAESTIATLPTVPALAICSCWALFNKLTYN